MFSEKNVCAIFLYSFDDFNLLDDDMIERKPCVTSTSEHGFISDTIKYCKQEAEELHKDCSGEKRWVFG